MKYDDEMDSEMIPLCDLLNEFEGITTTFCCFGHFQPGQFYIAFRCSNIVSLKRIIKQFESMYIFYIEAESIGPTSKPTDYNEISIRISAKRGSYYSRPKIITIKEINELCKLLRKELDIKHET